MGDLDLATLLTGLQSLVQDTRDRVVKMEGALTGLTEWKADVHARLTAAETEIAALKQAHGNEAAVDEFRTEALANRRWLISAVCMSTGTMVGVVAFILDRVVN